MLSLYGLVFRAGVALGSVVIGALASDFGLPWPVGIAAFACIFVAFFMRRRVRQSVR